MSPLPADLPESIDRYDREVEAAVAKYVPLVHRLGTMEFLGLLEATTRELRLRSIQWDMPELNAVLPRARPDPGTRLGNRG